MSMTFPSLSVCAKQVRSQDPDRFFCTLFISRPQREVVFQLLAFNIEVGKAVCLPKSWSVAGPMAGLIRLQWWREFVEGKAQYHEIAAPIRESLTNGMLQADDLLGLIKIKEEELDGIEDWGQWQAIMMGSAGQIQKITARIIGIKDASVLKAVAYLGAAYEVIKIAQFLPVILASGRCPLPQNIIEEYHVIRGEKGFLISSEQTIIIRQLLIQTAKQFACQGEEAANVNRETIAAILPFVFAKRDLAKVNQWDQSTFQRGLGDKLAILQAALRGSTSLYL